MTPDEIWRLLRPLVEVSLYCMAYGVVIRCLAGLAQPYRLRLASLGEQLLRSGKLTDDERRAVEFSLDRAFSALPAFIAVFIVPYAMLVIAARVAVGRPPTGFEPSADMWRFLKLSILSFTAANPVCGSLATIEFVLVGFVVSLVAGQRTLSHAARSLLRAEAMAGRMSR